MTKGYRNGVRIVRFPGGRVARFHKPGTAAYARGVAKKKRMGKLLAKRFSIKKKRRGRGKPRRNPGRASRDIRTGPPRAERAPSFIYHSSVPASQRTLWVVTGTDYGYLHNSGGEIRTWKTRSGAATAAKKYIPLGGVRTVIGSNPGKRYQGYPSWNAWNVSLWIDNDEGLYRFARELKRKLGTTQAAKVFVDECGSTHTPDGAPFTVSSVKGAMSGM